MVGSLQRACVLACSGFRSTSGGRVTAPIRHWCADGRWWADTSLEQLIDYFGGPVISGIFNPQEGERYLVLAGPPPWGGPPLPHPAGWTCVLTPDPPSRELPGGADTAWTLSKPMSGQTSPPGRQSWEQAAL